MLHNRVTVEAAVTVLVPHWVHRDDSVLICRSVVGHQISKAASVSEWKKVECAAWMRQYCI